MLVVISGKAGSGKTSLMRKLLEGDEPLNIKSVSLTHKEAIASKFNGEFVCLDEWQGGLTRQILDLEDYLERRSRHLVLALEIGSPLHISVTKGSPEECRTLCSKIQALVGQG